MRNETIAGSGVAGSADAGAPTESSQNDVAEQALQQLLEANRRRRRTRLWVGVAAAPLALVSLLLVVKFLSMYVFAHQSIRSFVRLEFEHSVAMAEWQGVVNWFEPAKAHFNEGTALAEVGELESARAALERALEQAPAEEVCAVRYNLATVVERQGDRATGKGDVDAGQQLYLDALEILGAAPPSCAKSEADAASPDPQRSMAESLEALAKRIMEKIRQPQGSGGSEEQEQQDPSQPNPDQQEQGESPEEQPQEEGPSDSQLDEIEEKLRDGAEERQQREQGQSDTGGFGGGGVDRPW